MAITRVLPKTSAGRARALKAAKDKNDSIPVPDRFLTPATEGRLNAAQPNQKSLRDATALAKANMVEATKLVEAAKALDIKYVSHFIQVFAFAVARGVYPSDDFPFYKLPEDYKHLPEIRTEQKLAEWVDNIVVGEGQRTAAGGAAMSNPTAAEVSAAGADFNAKNIAQSPLKDAFDNAQQAEKAFELEADGTILKVWDEGETRYNEEEKSSRRRKLREWGVVYESDVTNTFNLHVQDAAPGHASIADADVELVQSGNTKTTNASGDCIIKSRVIDEVTFEIIHPDYITQQVTVTLVDGQTVYGVTVDLVHV